MEVMETRQTRQRDTRLLLHCYKTRADLVCHVAGIGVMAKIFGGKKTLRQCFDYTEASGLGEILVKE